MTELRIAEGPLQSSRDEIYLNLEVDEEDFHSLFPFVFGEEDEETLQKKKMMESERQLIQVMKLFL
jgi:hypothetical protein